MKKTLIASAITAASMASVAQAAEMASMPEFYGNIQLAYVHTSVEPDGGAEVTTNDFGDNGSTLGFKHSHEIAPGMTGFLKAELEFDADENHGDGINKVDEAYIGVKGDFGSVQVGTDDTVYEWWDVIDIAESVGIAGELGGAAVYEGDNVQYVSPIIAGGLTIGATIALDSTETHSGALGAKYKTDMFEVIFGYSLGREENFVDTGDAFGLGGKVFLGDLTVGAEYESKSADSANGVDDKSTEVDDFGLIAIYALGASQLAAGYQRAEYDNDTEVDAFYLQALHNISDNMYAYVEYTNASADVSGGGSTDTENFAIGSTYYF